MTYVIAEPCIDVKDRACVDVCPVEAIFPEDALPDKWIEFTAVNAAYLEGSEVVDGMVEDYCARNQLPAIEGHR